jgi:hypothetical protein
MNFFGLVTLACLLVWVQNHGKKWLMFAGVTAAAAFWSEQFGALSVTLVLFAVLWEGFHERCTPRSIRDGLLTALAGMLIMSAPFLIYLVTNGATSQFFQAIIGVPLSKNVADVQASAVVDRVLDISDPFHFVSNWASRYLTSKFLWPGILAYVVLTIWRWGRNGSTDKSILLLTYFSSLYSVTLVYRPIWETHVFFLIPLMAIGTASLMVFLLERQTTWLRAIRIRPSRVFRSRFNLIPIMAGIFLLSIICMSVVNVASSYQAVQGWGTAIGAAEVPPGVIAYIDKHTTASQRILATSNPMIYYLSGRQPAIAHFFVTPYLFVSATSSIMPGEVQTCVDTKCAALIVVDYHMEGLEQNVVWIMDHSYGYRQVTVLDHWFGIYEIAPLPSIVGSIVVFYMQDSRGRFHPEGNISLSGLGSYPTDCHTHVKIPNGHYTFTVQIPSGFTLSKSSFGAWNSNPNNARFLEFSSRTKNPTDITLKNFDGALLVYIE